MNPTGRFGGTGESRSIRGAPAFGFSVTSGAYKSLKEPLEWADIPPFAIITGLNGAGKTQLLQAIAIQYDPGLKSRFVPTTDFATAISGHSYNSHDVYYVSTFSQAFTRDRLLTSQYGEQLGNLRSENYVDVYETAIRNAARTLPLAQFPLDALYLNLHAIERAIVYQFMGFLVKDGNLP